MKKKRVGRPAGQRPVVAMRLHPDVYATLIAYAKRHKLSIAEEARIRLTLSLHDSSQLGVSKKIV